MQQPQPTPAGPAAVVPADLAAQLAALWPADEQLQLVWTNNRTVLLSCQRRGSSRTIRLHHSFVAAGPQQAQAIVRYVRQRCPAAARELRQWLQAHRAQLPLAPAAPRRAPARARPVPRPQNTPHDLQAMFAALNAAYFHDACSARIQWGRAGTPQRRARRGMQLGCYVQADNLIRIHPALAQDFVPDYVVRGVVFHEMLHEIFGTPSVGGRRRIHPPEFVAVEQSHPDYARARAWEEANIGRLLRFRG